MTNIKTIVQKTLFVVVGGITTRLYRPERMTTDADNPNLSVWVICFEAIANSYFTRVNFKSSSVEIDRYNFAAIAGFKQGAYLSFVDKLASLGKFF